MSDRPSFTVEYLEPVVIEAEPLPDEFSASRLKRSLLIVGAIVVVVVALIVLVPGLSSLRDRFNGAVPGWLAFAAVLQLGSCASYVLVFRAVFCRRMSWRTSSEIGLSELAANSVFSIGGAGGLALGAWILRRGGLPASYIARRTVAFFLLTSLANVGFLALGGTALATGVLHGSPSICSGSSPRSPGSPRSRSPSACAPVAGAAGAALDARAARHGGRGGRRRRRRGAAAAAHRQSRDPARRRRLHALRRRDARRLLRRLRQRRPAAGVLLVAYLIGQLGSLIPIPGGIGGVDGGLIGTLVLYGVDAGDAAVAVIAYRGLLLAIPAPLGLPALAVLRRRLRDEAARHRRLRARRVGRGARPRGRERAVPVRRPEPEHQLVLVAPAPLLARLGRADDRMPALGVVRGRVAAGRVVAAADVAAGLAHAQVHPLRRRSPGTPRSRRRVGKLQDLDAVEVTTGGHPGMVAARVRRRARAAPARPHAASTRPCSSVACSARCVSSSACHCTPRQKLAAGSHSASTVPSGARAQTSRPAPMRSAAWWWKELTARSSQPVSQCSSEPRATSTSWAGRERPRGAGGARARCGRGDAGAASRRARR